MSGDFRSRVKLPEGFRFLREGDVTQPFRTRDKIMDKYVLRDYYAPNSQNVRPMLIVYETNLMTVGLSRETSKTVGRLLV